MSSPWIQTFSGRKFEFLNPTPDMIWIEDIAASLSKQVRFFGHTYEPYSIAQHSVHISDSCSISNAFAGLMHDGTEAYLGDLATPLKKLILEYQVIEQRVWKVIADRFGLSHDLPAEVKELDARILQNERRDLLCASPEPWNPYLESLEPIPHLSIRPWPSRIAEHEFLKRFYRLCPRHLI